MIIKCVENPSSKKIDFRLFEFNGDENFLFTNLFWETSGKIFSSYKEKFGKPYTGFFTYNFRSITFYKNGKEIYLINNDRQLMFLGKNDDCCYSFILCDNFIDLDIKSFDSQNNHYFKSYLTSNGIIDLPEEINIKNGIIENEFFHVSDKDFQIKIKKYINEL
jgi:hypothetical protein